MILNNKFVRFLAEPRFVIFPALSILRFLGSILHILQYRLLHKTQVNSLRKKPLIYAPHKAVEKAWMVNGT